MPSVQDFRARLGQLTSRELCLLIPYAADCPTLLREIQAELQRRKVSGSDSSGPGKG